jgi:hypothetical protein
MDESTALGLILAAVIGLLAALLILRRDRKTAELAASPPESPYAVSTEGEKRCPKCGMGNMWTDTRCISCGTTLR